LSIVGVTFGLTQRPRTSGELLTTFFLAVLALAWIVVLVPAMWRARSGAPLLSTKHFRRRMDLISPGMSGAGRWVVVLPSAQRRARPAYLRARQLERSMRRRRRLLGMLALSAIGSGVAAALLPATMLQVHLGIDAALALYVGVLLEAKRRRTVRAGNVYSMRTHRRRAVQSGLAEPLRAAGGRG
jgi:hypothetical protein